VSEVQVVAQAVPAQRYPAMHELDVMGGQEPLAGQFAAVIWVWVASLHEGARHWVLVLQLSQAPAPSQVPLLAQLVSGSVAAQRFLGSAPPIATGEQTPTLLVTLQLRQRPMLPLVASEQAVSQQTPSTQLPVPHSRPIVQVAP
jgi:hypothetical protein